MLCVASDTAGKQAQSACAGREMTGPSPIVLAMRQLIMLELDLSTLRRAIGGGSYARGAKDTIEEKVMALKARKARLFSIALDDGNAFGTAVYADDIRALLA